MPPTILCTPRRRRVRIASSTPPNPAAPALLPSSAKRDVVRFSRPPPQQIRYLSLPKLFPIPCRGQQLQTDGKGVRTQGDAIDHAGPGAEISRKGLHVQALILLQRLARNNTRSMPAHIFRYALLRALADVETREIHPYIQWNSFFQSARQGFHRTPHRLCDWDGECRGRERQVHHTPVHSIPASSSVA